MVLKFCEYLLLVIFETDINYLRLTISKKPFKKKITDPIPEYRTGSEDEMQVDEKPKLKFKNLPGCFRHTSSLLTGGGETAKSSANVLTPKKIIENVLNIAFFCKKFLESNVFYNLPNK